MFKTIRTSKFTKFLVYYLCIIIFLEITQPMRAYALTGGPSQPEFTSFTPIGTSDMVDLTSGDLNYNIPIMDVGGYPINLAYDSGVTMDQEASWVGLGWNLNIGQINRNVRGIPDDFKGDGIITENNLKKNVTVSVNPYINVQAFGTGDSSASLGLGAGIEVKYNNYYGFSANPSFSAGLNLGKNISLGVSLSSSDEMGASISPSVSLSTTKKVSDNNNTKLTGKLTGGITYNSRQGLQNFNLSTSFSAKVDSDFKTKDNKDANISGNTGIGSGGSISFANTTFTPTKRVAMHNEQAMFSFSIGGTVWGVQGEGSISASASVQNIKDKVKTEKAFGYENTHLATQFDTNDFNRENEPAVFSQNTNVLPVTNYTYDVLSIQSQGMNGMIRPYRGQAGFVYDPVVSDESSSTSISAEIEFGWGLHFGGSFKHTNSINYTSPWSTPVTPYLNDRLSNKIDYERVYFKNVGETTVDSEHEIMFNQNFGGNTPITLKLLGDNAINKFSKKVVDSNGYSSNLQDLASFNTSTLRRTHRELRNKGVQKITKAEASKYELLNKFIIANPYAEDHHTAAYFITDENGNRTIFGETVYNIEKSEVSFTTDSQNINVARGTVTYNPNENTISNSSGIDHYFNRVRTPKYAHTYLISSVLSSDYQDLSMNGPTDDDLGSYTKFTYTNSGDINYTNSYQWRVPFKNKEASYNEGLKTNSKDQKASYLHGSKEVKYIKKIETKTHIALFDLELRNDGYGVETENGGLSQSTGGRSYCLKSIRLFAKKASNGQMGSKPIKTAHFKYNYSLCPGIDNNATGGGKLTLEKVYFTYENSNMGQYTPYEFTYTTDPTNGSYNPKDYDIWGNYKKNTHLAIGDGNLSPQDFPYVDQENRTQQNAWATLWTLSEVKLPSGGKIVFKMESDDYQFVQNKKAMQMYKVVGVSSAATIASINTNNQLYEGPYDANFVVVKTNISRFSSEPQAPANSEILRRCTEGLIGKPIYFDFMLNMNDSKFDHITGYFEMDGAAQIQDGQNTGDKFIFIPMKKIDREGKVGGSNLTNPISVAGWFFGRSNLYKQIYGLPEPGSDTPNIVELGRSLVNNLELMLTIFTGENYKLQNDLGCAKTFIPSQSWIRLNEPTGFKVGGGSRVKTLEMYDAWESMMNVSINSPDIERYKKKYGQEYDYKLDFGSSGVATYEPNICKENPLVQPFYHEPEKLSAQKYEEKPFGASFYPNAAVTYSKVSVKNITSSDDDVLVNGNESRKTRSGKVVTHHYTTYDFPTKTDFTDLSKSKHFYSNEESAIPNIFLGMFGLGIEIKNELTMTQGFYIETNDMNGKVKKQEVFDHANNLISYVENKYSVEENDLSTLKNDGITVIDKNGQVSQQSIGIDYDVVNDLRKNYNYSKTSGVNANLDILYVIIGFAIVPIPIPIAFFDNESSSQTLQTAVTTKVVHKTGILKEKIAFDLGSTVSTKNLAWDAQTGQVVVTQTTNEFDDQYYSINFPAYWYYGGMDMASKNFDITGKLLHSNSGSQLLPNPYFKMSHQTPIDLTKYFALGDELFIEETEDDNPIRKRAWVFGFNSTNDGILLMDEAGNYIDQCGTDEKDYLFRILRSGYKNNQMAGMSSITTMKNPLDIPNGQNFMEKYTFAGGLGDNPRIINASAIEYSDFWPSPNENNSDGSLPQYPNDLPNVAPQDLYFPNILGFNPFLKNYKGNWRPVKSYAYLTSRKSSFPTLSNSNIRNNGFFAKFSPFYNIGPTGWVKTTSGWKAASEVTQYTPFGNEIENKDALDRYSSAQYGYKNRLPVAVASNSKYTQMGFTNFEDHGMYNPATTHFDFDSDPTNSPISTLYAHTGKKSIMVKRNRSASLIRPLLPEVVPHEEVYCILPLPCPDIVENTNQMSLCEHIDGNPQLDLLITHEPTATIPGGIFPLDIVNITSFKIRPIEVVLPPFSNTTALVHQSGSNPADEIFQICYTQFSGPGEYQLQFTINYNDGNGGTIPQVITMHVTVSPVYIDGMPGYDASMGTYSCSP